MHSPHLTPEAAAEIRAQGSWIRGEHSLESNVVLGRCGSVVEC